jgi:hypothetical protein
MATERMPNSVAARKTRMAISPLFAASSFLNLQPGCGRGGCRQGSQRFSQTLAQAQGNAAGRARGGAGTRTLALEHLVQRAERLLRGCWGGSCCGGGRRRGGWRRGRARGGRQSVRVASVQRAWARSASGRAGARAGAAPACCRVHDLTDDSTGSRSPDPHAPASRRGQRAGEPFTTTRRRRRSTGGRTTLPQALSIPCGRAARAEPSACMAAAPR